MPHRLIEGKTGSNWALSRLNYRLALDIGSQSLGWAMVRLDAQGVPCAVIRTGVRIFSDGRNPKDGSSLAVERRMARAMRRRRDRLLRRKARMMRLLVQFGFFPAAVEARKALERQDPYALRARGLDHPLTGAEFGRALFHLNQRRGFRSNRRTDRAVSDAGPMKSALAGVRNEVDRSGREGMARTVGEWLWRRHQAQQPVRARFRQTRVVRSDGRSSIHKSYDLYVDRQLVADEFDALWAVQASSQPALFTAEARDALRECLLFQRPLRPVQPGRCTFLPDEPRAPLALPTTQRFRMLQEVNHLRLLNNDLTELPLTMTQRDVLMDALERKRAVTFNRMRTLLGLPSGITFNLEGPKRTELKGNLTSVLLADPALFGEAWYGFERDRQDRIVTKVLEEESEDRLIAWLCAETSVTRDAATEIADAKLPDGYGALSRAALGRVVPVLEAGVVSFAAAAEAAGFSHTAPIANRAQVGRTFAIERVETTTGEVQLFHVHGRLPYYGEALPQHVAFGTGELQDAPERRYGRIANPTVHVALNQVRVVVNALLARYGHPAEVVLEVARDLRHSAEERRAEDKRQADNQARNDRLRGEAARLLGVAAGAVKRADIERLRLWEELSPGDALARQCPYSGAHISAALVLTDAVEVDHILPFSRTLDDSLENKTLALREANRLKGNRTPWEARDEFAARGWAMEDVLARVATLSPSKRRRFGAEGYARWLGDNPSFLARALNDTRYINRVAQQYLSLVCPYNTRVIPGRLTALLRGKFGLNDILGQTGAKNRNDHRHHAVDACVVAVTDQGLLQRVASANQRAREGRLERLVDQMPLPWPMYRDHVERAVQAIRVSHKPDHGHEGRMHNDTAYGLLGGGLVHHRVVQDGVRVDIREPLAVIPVTEPRQADRHGRLPDGSPRPYKGYKGDSNYCLDIVVGERGRWQGQVVSRFEAYQAVRRAGSTAIFRSADLTPQGYPLVMRARRHDVIRMNVDGHPRLMRIVKLGSNGQVTLAEIHEANVDARNRNAEDSYRYTSKTAATLQASGAIAVTVSPIGDVRAHSPHAVRHARTHR